MQDRDGRSRLTGWPFRIAAAAILPPLLAAMPARARAQTINPVASTSQASQQAGATVATYCATCHNARLRTAGLVLDPQAINQAAASAEQWEKVIRKLEAKAMPPPGAPRPTRAAYDDLKAYLETTLDGAAAARPHPGKVPLLRRLTRTEYQNAIRDLLALDALPKDMEYSMLLPPDNAMSGFDNIADLLFVSPTA